MVSAATKQPAIEKAESPKKAHIRRVAYRVMHELGFNAASYSEIAKQSGYGRPLVQMYFPKKDQFLLDMTEDSIDLIFRILQAEGMLMCGTYEKTLRVAQAYFSLMFRDWQSVRLTREILSHKSILRSVFSLYQMKVITMGFHADPKDINVSTLKALGGVEELVAEKIDNGEKLDADDIACQLLGAMKVFLDDNSYRNAYAEMAKCLLSRAEVNEVIAIVVKEILPVTNEEQIGVQPLVRSIA